MAVNLPLEEMSVADKLQLLEAIWADLSRVPDHVESPAWHTEALEETKKRIQSEEATFSDWQKAKASIRDRLR
jgi:Putative addiction module component